MNLFDRKTKEIVKPFFEMTELEKLEFLRGELEQRKVSLAAQLKKYDDIIAEYSGQLQQASEERERIAQQAAATVAGSDFLAQKIADMKSEEVRR